MAIGGIGTTGYLAGYVTRKAERNIPSKDFASIGGIHLPDFNDKYVFSKKKSGISDEEYRKQIREQAYLKSAKFAIIDCLHDDVCCNEISFVTVA